MTKAEAVAYYRSRAMHYQMLAGQVKDAKRAAQYRELAAAFAKEAGFRDGGLSGSGTSP